jgi:hypothetical protein
LSNEVERVPGIAFVKDDVPLSERSLVGDDAAGVHGRQDALEQEFAARVWSPSFGLGRHDSQLLHRSTHPLELEQSDIQMVRDLFPISSCRGVYSEASRPGLPTSVFVGVLAQAKHQAELHGDEVDRLLADLPDAVSASSQAVTLPEN